MAISFVGSNSSGAANGGSVTVTFSASPGDLVLVSIFNASSNFDNYLAPSSEGWTLVADIFRSNTGAANLLVFYKFMGTSPNTSVTVYGSGSINDSLAVTAHVFRGVDSVVLDVPVTAATGIAAHPNPPLVTAVTDGAWGYHVGGLAETVNTNAWTSTGGLLGLQSQRISDTNRALLASGYLTGSTKSFDPTQFSNGFAVTSGASCAALSLALRPAPDRVSGAVSGQFPLSALSSGNLPIFAGGESTFDLSGSGIAYLERFVTVDGVFSLGGEVAGGVGIAGTSQVGFPLTGSGDAALAALPTEIRVTLYDANGQPYPAGTPVYVYNEDGTLALATAVGQMNGVFPNVLPPLGAGQLALRFEGGDFQRRFMVVAPNVDANGLVTNMLTAIQLDGQG